MARAFSSSPAIEPKNGLNADNKWTNAFTRPSYVTEYLWRNRSLNYACESCVGGGGSSRSGCYKKARKMSVWFMEIEQGSS